MPSQQRPGDPSEERVRLALDEFRLWVQNLESDISFTRIIEAAGISRSAAHTYSKAGAIWRSDPRSLYWTWLKRRHVLLAMDATSIVSLSNEFRAVRKRLGVSVLAVGQSWWDNDGYDGLGVDVRVNGGEIEVVVLSQADDTEAAGAVPGAAGDGAVSDDERPAESDDDDAFPGRDLSENGLDEDPDAAGDAAVTSDVADLEDVSAAAADTQEVAIRADDASPGDFLRSGDLAVELLSEMDSGAQARIEERIRQASTVADVAIIAGAPVLVAVPGLSLEDAKMNALLRVSGWNPGRPDRDEEGNVLEYKVRTDGRLSGDGINMLFYGEGGVYADEGARLVAFAGVIEWGPDSGVCYYAQQMRTGVTMASRRDKHAISDHDGRGLFLGYRMANWAPERQYPDSDWFFGSEGTLDRRAVQRLIDEGVLYEDDMQTIERLAEDDIRRVHPSVRRPSRAEVLARWYLVRSIADAFSGVEGFARTPFGLVLERERLFIERRMLSEEYGITLFYHGEGRAIPYSTRVSERRWMLERIEDIGPELRQTLDQLKTRRFLNTLVSGFGRAMRRGGYKGFYRRQRRRGVVTGADRVRTREEMERDGAGWVRSELEYDYDVEEHGDAGLGVGVKKVEGVDWVNYESRFELSPELRFGSLDPEAFCGLDYTHWGVLREAWNKRDRGRWYTYLADDGSVVGDGTGEIAKLYAAKEPGE